MARRRKRTKEIEKDTMDVINDVPDLSADVLEDTPSPEEKREARAKEDPMAALAPSAVFEEKKNDGHSGIEVVETFFSSYKDRVDAGVNPVSGLRLDPHLYVKIPRDSEGNPLVRFRWGSKRAGFPEKNAAGGWVPVRINEEKELDPKGRMVEVGGMVLLAKTGEEYEKRQEMKTRYAVRQTRSNRSRAARTVAQTASKEGLENLVSVRDKAETLTIANEKEE